jgi:hypothetical protein
MDYKLLDIEDARRELKRKDERIEELRQEVDETRELLREMEEHVQDRDSYLENWISTFGMELGDDGCWHWGKQIGAYNTLFDAYEALRVRFNKLVGEFNKYCTIIQPVGRPLAASPAQEDDVRKRHRRGQSLRSIAEDTSLGFRTVRTIIERENGTDRTTVKRRERIEKPVAMLSAKRSREYLAKEINPLREKARELLQEAKGLGRK